MVVTDIVQDQEGYIWVATFGGVFRYDGTSFQQFGEAEGLPPHMTLHLAETPDGVLWVVSNHCLFRRDGARFRMFDLKAFLLGPQPVTWMPQSNSFVLSTTEGLATVAVRGGMPGRLSFDVKTKGVAVSSVHAALDGSLWYGAKAGVCRRKGVKDDCFGPQDGVPKDQWTGIRMDKNSDVWIRSEKQIRRLAAGSMRFEKSADGLPPADGVGVLNLDRERNLFVPTQLGLARLVKGSWQLIGMHQGMTSNSILVTLEDREGSLWIGGLGAGLERWRGYDTWEGWTELDGLENDSILAIEPTAPDHLFLGTDHGLVEFQVGRGVVHTWLEKDGLAGDHVYALSFDNLGNLWIGSSPGGLSLMNRATGRIDKFPVTASESVLSFAVDPDGSMWVGTDRRVLHFERSGNGRPRLVIPSGTPVGYSPGLLRDRNGRIWRVTSGNLYFWDAGHWMALESVPGLTRASALNIAEGKDGGLFVLSVTGGVFRLSAQDGNWAAIALPPLSAPGSLVPYFLRSDRRGTLWVGTDRGVFTLEANGKEWRWYTEDDGLVWNDTNIGAFHVGSADDVWIGTSRGLAHYSPKRNESNRSTPRAAIVSVAVNGRKLDGAGPFSSGYPISSVQFQVTALTFTNEERNRFLYRLRGIDSGWLHTSSHEIAYSGLRPGRYTFDVLAQSPDGKLSSKPATAVLIVDPPWYLTHTFLVLAVSGTLLLLVAVFRWRTHSFLIRQKELEAAVAERTHELQVEQRFERDQAQIMEMIVSSSGLDEILNSIAEMVRTYPPGIDCSIATHREHVRVSKPGMTVSEISSTSGEAIGWIYFSHAIGDAETEAISKIVSVAKRLAAVAIETRGTYEMLDHQANHDLLTGLANRLRFQNDLQLVFDDAVLNCGGFAVIYIDLDRFKQINDRYGHRTGDMYLQELSNRFRSCVREGDVLARLGGDEFAVILPGVSTSAVAERIVQTLASSLHPPVVLPGCVAQAAASFGFSIYPNDAENCEALIRAADHAMYNAKQRNRSTSAQLVH